MIWKVSDYIVDTLVKHKVTHIFGYQGTMIAHFVDSICRNEKMNNHSCYNEQGAAFAAVGYAKATGKIGVAYATSGPGALNLVSGIADAYFDSTPTLFITGQINLNEYTGISTIRQHAFQEVDIVSSVRSYTKYCVQITNKEDIRYELEKALFLAQEGRKGPILLDIPMNIQREFIEPEKLHSFIQKDCVYKDDEKIAQDILQEIKQAKKPVLLLGNGVRKNSEGHYFLKQWIEKLKIPVITSMPAKHLFTHQNSLYMGYIGAAYGNRAANMIASKKADLIVSIGCSMCKRQTGVQASTFAKEAKIIRVDIDKEELKRNVHDDDIKYCMDYHRLIKFLLKNADFQINSNWVTSCLKIKEKLTAFDINIFLREPNTFIKCMSDTLKEDANIFVDVGQHQIWVAQSYDVKNNQQMFFSGGHGAMGFALPAGIGGYYASRKRSIVICGDGAFQMNIQELQWVVREKIPILIFIFNNHSLGLIRQQQDDFFGKNHYGSANHEYDTPSFKAIGEAYGIPSFEIHTEKELILKMKQIQDGKPYLFEILVDKQSKAYPKTYFGEEMHNQKPYISKEMMDELLNL